MATIRQAFRWLRGDPKMSVAELNILTRAAAGVSSTRLLAAVIWLAVLWLAILPVVLVTDFGPFTEPIVRMFPPPHPDRLWLTMLSMLVPSAVLIFVIFVPWAFVTFSLWCWTVTRSRLIPDSAIEAILRRGAWHVLAAKGRT